jgi:prophage regulatory protein
MNVQIKEQFSENINRLKNLVSIYESYLAGEGSGRRAFQKTDVLRAATVFLQASLKDLLCNLAHSELPVAAAVCTVATRNGETTDMKQGYATTRTSHSVAPTAASVSQTVPALKPETSSADDLQAIVGGQEGRGNFDTRAIREMLNTAGADPKTPRRTIRRTELRQIVPLADSTIYEMERRGEFPLRFFLTPRCMVWDLAEVMA